MKKNIKRIFESIFAFMIVLQNFCYADVIATPSTIELIIIPLVLVGIGVLIISIISFYLLKFTKKNQSSVLRIKKLKKVSIIICGITIVSIYIIAMCIVIPEKMAKNYNRQFLQYEKFDLYGNHGRVYVDDIEGLINTTIENNKTGRKINIYYNNKSYETVDELKQLLSKLDTNKNYSYYVKYDRNYKYIESISLTSYPNPNDEVYGNILGAYKFKNENGDNVKTNIKSLISSLKNKDDFLKDNKIAIILNLGKNQKIKVNLKENNSQEIADLIRQIEDDKLYDMDYQIVSDDACNVIITKIN